MAARLRKEVALLVEPWQEGRKRRLLQILGKRPRAKEEPVDAPPPPPRMVESVDMCPDCDTPLLACRQESDMGCPLCLRSTSVMEMTCQHVAFGEQVHFQISSYQHPGHFKLILRQVQGRGASKLPWRAIAPRVRSFLDACDVRGDLVTNVVIRRALHALHISGEYYATMANIAEVVRGCPVPQLTDEEETKACLVYRRFYSIWEKHRPEGRINFMGYHYTGWQICRILGYTRMKYSFVLPTLNKSRELDRIFRPMCEELGLTFAPAAKLDYGIIKQIDDAACALRTEVAAPPRRRAAKRGVASRPAKRQRSDPTAGAWSSFLAPTEPQTKTTRGRHTACVSSRTRSGRKAGSGAAVAHPTPTGGRNA
jgi:hypothetical protein